jgi:hypothetical protein
MSSAVENNSLYNIDEDREVESSFQYSANMASQNYLLKKSSTTTALPNITPATNPPPLLSQQQTTMNTSTSSGNVTTFNRDMSLPSMTTNNASCSSPSSGLSMSGRFTPACFPGRTTPDFRHSASLFEQQGTRASIISPLTVGNGLFGNAPATTTTTTDAIPIAIAFNETVHAFFKINDSAKFKLKCFGCMKISFPYAAIKLLTVGAELPKLGFNLAQLQIANQDLKLNQQLLLKSSSSVDDEFNFEFIMNNLSNELRQQHSQNKQAAFFNFELLKYEFKPSVGQQPPLTLNAVWTQNAETNTIELTVDYTLTFRKQLSQVNFMLIMPLNSTKYKITFVKPEDGGSSSQQQLQETEDKMQILWQMPTLNSNGQLLAKFHITSQLDSELLNLEQFYQPVYVKFHIDQATLSQVRFGIAPGCAYKLSLLKEKVETGKYFCSSEPQQPQAQVQQYQQSKTMLLMKPSLSSTSESVVPPPLPSTPAPQMPVTVPIAVPSGADVTAVDEKTTSTSLPDSMPLPQSSGSKKPNLTGSLSTNIGSTVDILLNY